MNADTDLFRAIERNQLARTRQLNPERYILLLESILLAAEDCALSTTGEPLTDIVRGGARTQSDQAADVLDSIRRRHPSLQERP